MRREKGQLSGVAGAVVEKESCFVSSAVDGPGERETVAERFKTEVSCG